MTDMYYTGIGSRNTPTDILQLMDDIAVDLGDYGYTLRSGGAVGADSAFERGCDSVRGKKEIYLPWKWFNENSSLLYEITPEAYAIAETIYGCRWKTLPDSIRKLMARNIYQVTGKTLDKPSDFVVCWTPDGATIKRTNKSGGTGQAISYANTVHAPVFNLKNDNDFDRLMKYVEQIGAITW